MAELWSFCIFFLFMFGYIELESQYSHKSFRCPLIKNTRTLYFLYSVKSSQVPRCLWQVKLRQGNSKFEVHLVRATQNFMIFTKMGCFGIFWHLHRKRGLTNAPTFEIDENGWVLANVCFCPVFRWFWPKLWGARATIQTQYLELKFCMGPNIYPSNGKNFEVHFFLNKKVILTHPTKHSPYMDIMPIDPVLS